MAGRMTPRIMVWFILCMWLFISSLVIGTLVLLLYVYDSSIQSFFGGPLTRLTQTIMVLLGGWTVILFGSAIRTAKANRRPLAMVFLLFALLGFAGEMLIMITLARHREQVFGHALLTDAIMRLVQSYSNSSMSRTILNTIHVRFDCCGVDEWHREWKNVPRYPGPSDSLKQEPWVPSSCCVGLLQTSPVCGFSKLKDPDSMDQIARKRGLILQTAIPEPWYARLRNDPCPDLMIGWLREVPIYVLMIGLTTSVARMMITFHAVFAYTDSKKKKASRR